MSRRAGLSFTVLTGLAGALVSATVVFPPLEQGIDRCFAAEHAPHFRPDMGMGWDLLLNRAMNDPWALAHTSTYERRDAGFQHRIDSAVAQATKARGASAAEVAVDIDQDGVADFWVYFDGPTATFIEGDRFRTGCHDLRVDLRDTSRPAKEIYSWFTEPPVPLPALAGRRLSASDYYDRAVPAKVSAAQASEWAKIASRLFPDLAAELGSLAKQTPDGKLADELSRHESRAISLIPKFQEIFREQELAKKLRTPVGWRMTFSGYDLDQVGGEEVAAGYSPWGVERIQFHKEDWRKWGGLIADCFLEEGAVVRIDLPAGRYFKVGGFWARFRDEGRLGGSRLRMAEARLLPGFQKYREGRWYEAAALWREGWGLASLTGDFALGRSGRPGGLAPDPEYAHWDFPVQGQPAKDLVSIARGFGEPTGEYEGIVGLARAAARGRRFEEALDLYSRCQRLSVKFNRTLRQVNALEEISQIYARMGNYDLAIQRLLESLDMEATLGYARDVIRNLDKLITYDDSDEGVASPTKLLLVMQMRSHAMAVNRACKLAVLASMYGDLGEQTNAQRYLGEAERIFKNLGHRTGQADVLNVKAKWDLADNRAELAIDRLQAAMQLLDQHDSAVAQIRTDTESHLAGKSVHVFELNEGHELDRVALVAPSHPLSYRALSATWIAQAYLQQADRGPASDTAGRGQLLDLAWQWQTKASEWYHQAADSEGQLVAQLQGATIAYGRMQFPEALKLAEQAGRSAQEQQFFEIRWRALALQGASLEALGRTGEALDRYLAAAESIESVRAVIGSESVRSAFLGSKLAVYQALALIYAARGEDAKVWEWMERAKARSLLDMIAGQPLEVKGPEVARLSREEPLLFGYLRGSADPARSSAAGLEKQYAQFLARITDQPLVQEWMSTKRAVRPVGLKAVQDILGEKRLLIEYFATDQDLLAAVISHDDLKIVKIAGYGMAALNREVAALRGQLQVPNQDYQDQARKLYRDLLVPCLRDSNGYEHLVIVPAEALHYLPFQTLLMEGRPARFVVQRWRVSYAPSASALWYAHFRSAVLASAEPPRALVVGEALPVGESAPLPGAEQEAKEVYAILSRAARTPSDGGELLIDAKETTVKARLPSAGVFHFAGHAELLPNFPMRSALICREDVENDGRLEVRELFGLHLSGCRLAVLSACETRVDRLSRGDEITGLTRAFLRAGVPSVVASQWKVDDEATRRFMTVFYENLSQKGMGTLEALHRAQFSMINEYEPVPKPLRAPGMPVPISRPKPPSPETTRSVHRDLLPPFYWAGFVLMGDWR